MNKDEFNMLCKAFRYENDNKCESHNILDGWSAIKLPNVLLFKTCGLRFIRRNNNKKSNYYGSRVLFRINSE